MTLSLFSQTILPLFPIQACPTNSIHYTIPAPYNIKIYVPLKFGQRIEFQSYLFYISCFVSLLDTKLSIKTTDVAACIHEKQEDQHHTTTINSSIDYLMCQFKKGRSMQQDTNSTKETYEKVPLLSLICTTKLQNALNMWSFFS